MKRIVPILMALLVLAACAGKQSPSYIVQVSLGPWQSADYSASQIIARLDTVASIIPMKNVIIGWTAQPEIYKEVGAYLHGKGIGMYLWLPVFAETEEVCDNTPAVDLWGREPANYDLAAGEDFRLTALPIPPIWPMWGPCMTAFLPIVASTAPSWTACVRSPSWEG